VFIIARIACNVKCFDKIFVRIAYNCMIAQKSR
jgi:hypothetical protein